MQVKGLLHRTFLIITENRCYMIKGAGRGGGGGGGGGGGAGAGRGRGGGGE